jgi:hypothetical protein
LRHLPKLANAVSVRAGVDGVVFEDGEFVGPNLTHVFEYYVAANSQFRETMQELRMLKTQTDATVIAKLRVIARTPPERLQGLRSITLRRSMAKLLENVLQNSGRGEFEKVLSSLAPPEPNVWKQQR